MKNEKRTYTAPTAELVYTQDSDVISTSGFDGADHVFGTKATNEDLYKV